MIKRAQRLNEIVGFGIDRVAASAEETGGRHRGPILRMENLDTDLPLPPEALEVTRAKLDDPKSNSWLPFTGDLDLRAAISDFTAERTGHRYDPEREIVITAGGMEGLLNAFDRLSGAGVSSLNMPITVVSGAKARPRSGAASSPLYMDEGRRL